MALKSGTDFKCPQLYQNTVIFITFLTRTMYIITSFIWTLSFIEVGVFLGQFTYFYSP